jgi:hypothetical protein
MTEQYNNRCHCGAPAEIGVPADHEVRWLCRVHAPWACVGCGPEAADEDRYPTFQNDDEEAQS